MPKGIPVVPPQLARLQSHCNLVPPKELSDTLSVCVVDLLVFGLLLGGAAMGQPMELPGLLLQSLAFAVMPGFESAAGALQWFVAIADGPHLVASGYCSGGDGGVEALLQAAGRCC